MKYLLSLGNRYNIYSFGKGPSIKGANKTSFLFKLSTILCTCKFLYFFLRNKCSINVEQEKDKLFCFLLEILFLNVLLGSKFCIV